MIDTSYDVDNDYEYSGVDYWIAKKTQKVIVVE